MRSRVCSPPEVFRPPTPIGVVPAEVIQLQLFEYSLNGGVRHVGIGQAHVLRDRSGEEVVIRGHEDDAAAVRAFERLEHRGQQRRLAAAGAARDDETLARGRSRRHVVLVGEDAVRNAVVDELDPAVGRSSDLGTRKVAVGSLDIGGVQSFGSLTGFAIVPKGGGQLASQRHEPRRDERDENDLGCWNGGDQCRHRNDGRERESDHRAEQQPTHRITGTCAATRS